MANKMLKIESEQLQKNAEELVYMQTSKEIQEGLEKKTASTGTPIDKLHGAARFNAVLSNMGGGSKAAGGGGMQRGFNNVVNNQKAEAVIETKNNFIAQVKELIKRIG